MVNLREEQVRALEEAIRQHRVEEASQYIYREIAERSPADTDPYTKDEALAAVRRVIEVASRYGVTDMLALAQWSHIRLATGVEFYDLPAIRYFLDEPLLHPERKGKAVVEAFLLTCKRA